MCKDHIDHEHEHKETARDNSGEKERYLKVLFIGSAVLVIQIWGGLRSRSQSLLADSAHVATDCLNNFLSYLTAIMVEKLGMHEKRIRRAGKVLGAMLLLVTLGHIWSDAWERYSNPEETTGWLMFWASIIGGIGNVFMFRLLHNAPAHEKNVTNWWAILHVGTDLLSSAAVIFSSVIIWTTGCKIVDPITSIILCLFIGGVALASLFSGDDHSCDHKHHH